MKTLKRHKSVNLSDHVIATDYMNIFREAENDCWTHALCFDDCIKSPPVGWHLLAPPAFLNVKFQAASTRWNINCV